MGWINHRQGLTLAFALKANFVNRIFGFWDCGRSPKKHPHQNEEITVVPETALPFADTLQLSPTES